MEKTLLFISSIDPNHIKWIKNILYNNAEKILYKDEHVFAIIQDYNSVDNSNILNCLGLPFNADDIRSIRDLTDKHLTLLERMYYSGVS
jgi:hypothetical protein